MLDQLSDMFGANQPRSSTGKSVPLSRNELDTVNAQYVKNNHIQRFVAYVDRNAAVVPANAPVIIGPLTNNTAQIIHWSDGWLSCNVNSYDWGIRWVRLDDTGLTPSNNFPLIPGWTSAVDTWYHRSMNNIRVKMFDDVVVLPNEQIFVHIYNNTLQALHAIMEWNWQLLPNVSITAEVIDY